MKKISLLILFFVMACPSINTKDSLKTGKGSYNSYFSEGQINGEDIEDRNQNRDIDKIRVGVLLPLSGNAGKVGNNILKSIQLAMFETSKDDIILSSYDTKGTSFGALEAFNEAYNEGVDIILGPLFTQSVSAIMKEAANKGIPVISFSNNQTLMNKKNIYLMGFTPEQEIERIVEYAVSQEKSAFSAVLPNDTYGSTVSRVLKDTVKRKDAKIVKIDYYLDDKAIDGKVKSVLNSYAIPDRVYEEYENEKQKRKLEGNKEEVEFIINEEDKIYTDTILLIDTGKRLDTILNSINKNNTEGRSYQIIGLSKWDNENIFSNSNLIGAWFVAPDQEKYLNFEKRFFEVYSYYPIRWGSLGYDALNAVRDIYKETKDYNFTRDQITQQKGFDGIDGRFRFLPNGIVERQMSVYEIEDGYPEVLNKAPDKFLEY